MEKTKGVVLLAYGKRGYSFAAYNLALSIKRFNPNVLIALVHGKDSLNQIDTKFLDVLIPFAEVKDAGEAKINIYDYLPFDYNLFLDVDSLALRDVSPCIDELIALGGYYYTNVVDTHTIDKDNDFHSMPWAWAGQLWDKYNLSKEAIMPSTNSSIQFIKKCKESKELFDQIKANLADPIPLNELKHQWGGAQPDELYLNIALAQKGITGECKHYMFFGDKHNSLSFDQLTEKYCLLSFYGGKGWTKLRYTEWYDKLMHKYAREFNLSHKFKINLIIPDKHLNQKRK